MADESSVGQGESAEGDGTGRTDRLETPAESQSVPSARTAQAEPSPALSISGVPPEAAHSGPAAVEDDAADHSPTGESTDGSQVRPVASVEVATRRFRKRHAVAVAALLVAVAAAAATTVLVLRPSEAEKNAEAYLADLASGTLLAQFTNDATAIANAERVCTELRNGGTAEGFARDAAGVKVYCPEYYDSFTVIPTPEEQRDTYITALERADLLGLFSSDENAVASAEKFCSDLRDGADQQGLPEDQIAVEVYCPEFVEGFTVLRTEVIEGTFTLFDSDPSFLYPAIDTSGFGCEGSGGYGDIGTGTAVTVKNGAGEIIAQTSLGRGEGGIFLCEFPFSIELTEGEDQYVFEVSDRGSLSFTFTELITDGVSLTLGL